MTRPFDDDMAGGRAAAEEDTTEEAIYDSALEMLRTERPNAWWRYCRCPGCYLLVHDVDTYAHAMTCGELRARVIEDWKEADDYREARR